MKLATLSILLLAAFFSGCAAESANDVADEGTAEQASDLTGKAKHHYTPGVSDVSWHPGCGVVRMDAPPCESGLSMTYTKSYVDLTFTHKEHVDNGTHTLTITVDAWSYNTVHPMVAVHPETIWLSPKDLQMSTHYKVVVKDRTGNVIHNDDIATYLAM